MELKDFVNLYRRWLWLLIIALIFGLVSGYFASQLQTPIYEASTKVLVTRSRQQNTNDILAISDQQLVSTYLQILKTKHVLDEAGSKLGIDIDQDNVQVNLIVDTQILQIKVQDEDAGQAASIANTLVQILIEQNETLQAGRYSIYEESLNLQIEQVKEQMNTLQNQITQINQASVQDQLEQVNQQITDLQGEITTLEQEIVAFPTSLNATQRATIAEKQAQLDQLRSLLTLYQEIKTNLTFIGKPVQSGAGFGDPQVESLQSTLNLYQQLYLNLLSNFEAVRLARTQSTPTVVQIEEAFPPQRPLRPIPVLYTALSGLVGLILSAGAVLLIDYFDDTLKSAQKTEEILGIPVIGQIIEINSSTLARKNGGRPEIADRSSLLFSNAFGSLRINLIRLLSQKSLKTILITSPAVGEGKTTISTNLAATFVRSGKKVVLLDADFYHSQVHAKFDLDNQSGLSNILSDSVDWHNVAHDCDGITVVTSGAHSSSAELLESEKMTLLLEKLQKKADIVIIDGPPLFVVDAQILASQVDSILLVVRQGSTITAVAHDTLNQLKLLGADVLGAVMNRVPHKTTYYYGGYLGTRKAKSRRKKSIERSEPIESN